MFKEVKEIDEEVKKINLNPEKKKAMLTYQMERNYLRAEGKAEGIAEGEAKGRAEGKAEGIAEEKLRVAKLMLAKGSYSPQEIVELSGLSIDDIEKLKHDMHVEKQE